MKIEPVTSDKKANKASFAVTGVDVSFVNALRRTAMEEVPTLAIEDVEIRKNNSILYDEILAHRLGLVPLTTDINSYTMPAPGTSVADMGASNKVTLTISSSTTGYVYSSELKSADPSVKPVYSEMIIAKLLKGQKIEAEATAVMGQGKDHMKWSPGLVNYSYKPKITIKNPSNAEEIAAKFPKELVEVKAGKLTVNEPALISSRYIEIAEELSEGAISMEETEDSFVINVESWGQIDPIDIMSEAARVFDANLKDFQKALKEI